MIKTQMSYPCMAQTQKRLLQSKRTFSIKTNLYWFCCLFVWSNFFFDWM